MQTNQAFERRRDVRIKQRTAPPQQHEPAKKSRPPRNDNKREFA